MREFLNDGEVAVLNAAENILLGLMDRGTRASHTAEKSHDAFSLGKFVEACDQARGAIFNAKNVGNAHLSLGLTHEQLHNAPEPEPEPEPAAA